MKNTFRVIAVIEMLGGASLAFSLFGHILTFATNGQYLNLTIGLILLIPAASLILGGWWMFKFEKIGFLFSIIGQAFQTVVISTPWISYLIYSPLAFLIKVNTNGNLTTSLELSTDYALSFNNTVQFSEFGLNVITIALLIYLLRPYQLLKEYGRLPRRLKCENCNTNYGWDAEYKEQEIKCEFCGDVTKYEEEPHG
ncbi:MAG TPA: hypothetical protein DEQ34_06855 [Balneolaceae bacterium]|nr:hypothetical protein [Balneolaceae bacterium]|tara:strand:+ start:5516 stop:6106 length:591 start_codon:yes stop_codon:yes gene_type:complete